MRFYLKLCNTGRIQISCFQKILNLIIKNYWIYYYQMYSIVFIFIYIFDVSDSFKITYRNLSIKFLQFHFISCSYVIFILTWIDFYYRVYVAFFFCLFVFCQIMLKLLYVYIHRCATSFSLIYQKLSEISAIMILIKLYNIRNYKFCRRKYRRFIIKLKK